MATRSLTSKLFGIGTRRPRSSTKRPRHRASLLLEALEERLAPATFLVTNLNDSGAGSLRQAVTDANNTPGADLITFQPELTGTITLTGGQLTVTDSANIFGPGANLLTVSGNHASRVFELFASGTNGFIFSGLTIADGSSDFGGGMYLAFSDGTLTIQDCVFSGNSASSEGGGLFVGGNGASAITVSVGNSTFANNQATGDAAAVFADCTATMTNCTVSGNTASGAYGGLLLLAARPGQTPDLTLTNCTLAGNSGPLGPSGLEVYTQPQAAGATARYVNTIFANSASGTANVGGDGTGSSFTSMGHNLSDDGSGNLTAAGDLPDTRALLAPLGSYGGSEPTMPLLPGSPAIDAGTGTGASAADQRGVGRVGAVDIGAFESRGFSLSISGGNNQPALVNTAFASALSVQVTSGSGEPVQGGVVTFNAPGGGAGATLSTPLPLNAAGQTSVSAAANGTAGSYSVSAVANGFAPQSFSLTNLPPITLTPATLPNGTYGTAYNSQTLTATGGAGGPYTFTLASGALPDGLALDPGGALTGTPTAAGAFTFTVQAQDNGGFTGSQTYTLTVEPSVVFANHATLQLLPAAGQSTPKAVTVVLDSFQFGFHLTPAAGAGLRASFGALDVTAALSSAAHDLFDTLTKRVRYETAILTQVDAAEKPVAVWVLSKVFVTDHLITFDAGAPPALQLKFAFFAVTEATSDRSASWNQTTNTATGPDLPAGLTLHALPSPADTGLTLRLGGGSNFAATITLNGFRFGFHNPDAIGTSGVSAGRTSFDALDVTAPLSEASPALFSDLTAGRSFTTATLIQRDSAGHAVAAWALSDVRVTDDLLTGTSGGLPGEELKLTFGAVREATSTQAALWSRLTNTAGGPALPSGLTLRALPAPLATGAVLQLFTRAVSASSLGRTASAAVSLTLNSYRFGSHNTITIGAAGAAGRASLDPLDVTLALSSDSPAVLAALAGGAHYATAALFQKDAAGRNLAIWDLGMVFVSGDVVAGSGGDLPVEELTFSFGAVRQILNLPDMPGNPLITTWSQVKNSSSSPDIPLETDLFAPTIAVSAGPFTYDGAAHPAAATATGVSGDAVRGSFSFTYYSGTSVSGAGSSTPPTRAGTYTVVAGFASNDPNYASADSAPLTFSIAKATLTVTAAANTKTYGQAASDTGTVSGVVNGDGITASFSSPGDAATAPVGTGRYTITASLSDPNGKLSNYTVQKTDATLTVNKAPLTVAANDQTKITGEANPAFTVSYSGFVLGQGPGALGGRLTFSTPATPSSPPGTYAITPAGLASANYAITFVRGSLTVISYAQATTNLLAQVNAAGLPQDIQSSLDAQLQASIASFNAGSTTAGVSQLRGFINQVKSQRGKKIDAALADGFTAAAQRIINAVH
jgi:hypothetical protein